MWIFTLSHVPNLEQPMIPYIHLFSHVIAFTICNLRVIGQTTGITSKGRMVCSISIIRRREPKTQLGARADLKALPFWSSIPQKSRKSSMTSTGTGLFVSFFFFLCFFVCLFPRGFSCLFGCLFFCLLVSHQWVLWTATVFESVDLRLWFQDGIIWTAKNDSNLHWRLISAILSSENLPFPN